MSENSDYKPMWVDGVGEEAYSGVRTGLGLKLHFLTSQPSDWASHVTSVSQFVICEMGMMSASPRPLTIALTLMLVTEAAFLVIHFVINNSPL